MEKKTKRRETIRSIITFIFVHLMILIPHFFHLQPPPKLLKNSISPSLSVYRSPFDVLSLHLRPPSLPESEPTSILPSVQHSSNPLMTSQLPSLFLSRNQARVAIREESKMTGRDVNDTNIWLDQMKTMSIFSETKTNSLCLA